LNTSRWTALSKHRAGQKNGGWWWPYHDPILEEAMDAELGKSFDLLLGRRTYDAWASFWPTADGIPKADNFNGAMKDSDGRHAFHAC